MWNTAEKCLFYAKQISLKEIHVLFSLTEKHICIFLQRMVGPERRIIASSGQKPVWEKRQREGNKFLSQVRHWVWPSPQTLGLGSKSKPISSILWHIFLSLLALGCIHMSWLFMPFHSVFTYTQKSNGHLKPNPSSSPLLPSFFFSSSLLPSPSVSSPLLFFLYSQSACILYILALMNYVRLKRTRPDSLKLSEGFIFWCVC